MTDRPSDRAIAQALQWANEELDRRGPGETIALAAAVALIWHKAREFDASASPPEPHTAPHLASVEPTTNPPEIGSKSVVEPTAEQMSEWQPIETAPRDGTYVDVWDTSNGRTTNVKWEHGAWKEVTFGFESPVFVEINPQPTHWMPRPAPPEFRWTRLRHNP